MEHKAFDKILAVMPPVPPTVMPWPAVTKVENLDESWGAHGFDRHFIQRVKR